MNRIACAALLLVLSLLSAPLLAQPAQPRNGASPTPSAEPNTTAEATALIAGRQGDVSRVTPGASRSQRVSVSPDLLRSLSALGTERGFAGVDVAGPPGRQIRLNMFEGGASVDDGEASFTGTVESVQTPTSETTVLHGSLVDEPDASFTLTVHKGLISARVFGSSGLFQLHPESDGEYIVVEAAEDLDDDEPIPAVPPGAHPGGEGMMEPSAPFTRPAGEDGSRIDVLFL